MKKLQLAINFGIFNDMVFLLNEKNTCILKWLNNETILTFANRMFSEREREQPDL
jgi:hypothetical protein